MDLMTVRDKIIEQLATCAGLADWQGYSFFVDQFVSPAYFVGDPFEWTYDTTFGGGCTFQVPIRFAVPRADERTAQRTLSWVVSTGDDSPKAALEANASLDGEINYLSVISVGRWARYRTTTSDSYMGVELVLKIEA
jgi:hypothetical protein